MIQPDYRVLLDEEIWAYMDRSDSFYPPDAVSLTIDQQRAVYNRMCPTLMGAAHGTWPSAASHVAFTRPTHPRSRSSTITAAGLLLAGSTVTMMSAPKFAPRPATV